MEYILIFFNFILIRDLLLLMLTFVTASSSYTEVKVSSLIENEQF